MTVRKDVKPCARALEEEPARRPALNPDESPLAWLARRKDREGRPLIAKEEFDAGELLRRDFHLAQLAPHVTATWSPVPIDRAQRRAVPGFGLELNDQVVAARERVNRALHAVGPELAGILVDVCCHLKGLEALEKASGWPQRSGKIVLQLALQRLARHYGLIRDTQQPHGAHRICINRWGTDDYRPTIAREG